MTKLKEAVIAELSVRRLRGESLDKIADEIVMISNAVRKLRASRLNDATLYLLIQDAIGSSQATKYKPISMKVIKAVIDGMANLGEVHLKQKEKK